MSTYKFIPRTIPVSSQGKFICLTSLTQIIEHLRRHIDNLGPDVHAITVSEDSELAPSLLTPSMTKRFAHPSLRCKIYRNLGSGQFDVQNYASWTVSFLMST